MDGRTVYTVEKSEIKILHTGDTHLGSRQYHSDIRRQDFFDSFAKVISDAVENEMDAVVHTGDLFDNRNPTIEDLIETIAVLTPLKNAGIPFLGIVGNHEVKQNTQWLDIFESMGLAERIGSNPVIVKGSKSEIHFYGIDNLSGPRLSSFDFSVFDGNSGSGNDSNGDRIGSGKKVYNILMLHQLLEPILPGQPLSCDDFTNPIPIPFDAVLLGDNHKYECIKHNGAWVTYPGSTERCSASEAEPRSYNILTFDGNDISITRRTIPTRDFITIPIASNDDGKISVEDVYSKIDAYSEKIKDAVVFVELSGSKKTPVPISEIEEYVKNKGAVVARVGDKRSLEREDSEKDIQIVFRDPDEVVTQELRKLNLTEAGFLLDSIIRDTDTSKTNVTDVSEDCLKDFLENHDFKEEYRREKIFSENSEFSSDFDLNEKIEIETEDPVEVAGIIEQILHKQDEENGEQDVEQSDEQDAEQSDERDAEQSDEQEIASKKEQKNERDSKQDRDQSKHKPRQYTLGDMFGGDGE